MDSQAGVQPEAALYNALGVIFSHVRESWAVHLCAAITVLHLDALRDLVLDLRPMWDRADSKIAKSDALVEALRGMCTLQYLTLRKSPTLVGVMFEALASRYPPPCPSLKTLRLLHSDVWYNNANPVAFEVPMHAGFQAVHAGLRARNQRLKLLEIDDKLPAVLPPKATMAERTKILAEFADHVVLPQHTHIAT
jgi:hypothetical protein